ncbi:MAG: hypothetical protein FWE86_04985 [Oscillospiraceae bacterium]|nr:hypothetical protein [Oscillospiraceae bacterium]
MKNNRQIGLDGKAFISGCLRRTPVFSLILALSGLFFALGDAIKLLAQPELPPSVATLLSVDFVASLLLPVIVFYAHGLECGRGVPKLGERGLLIFGYSRLLYLAGLCYIALYRGFFVAVNPDELPAGLAVYYFLYAAMVLMGVLAESYLLNTLMRNTVRRGYINSLRLLGFSTGAVQSALVIVYIVARCTLGDAQDDFFTAGFGDFLRLCFAPAMYISLGFIFNGASAEVRALVNEVDSALKDKRYQINYDSIADKDKKRIKGAG